MNKSVTMGTRRQFFNVGSKEINNTAFNIAIVGELGVGKSALTVKYITRRFIMEYDPTLEDTYEKQENIDGQDIQVRIMDTYDAEESNPDRYLKWANGFLVVYSITSQDSFEAARRYLESITKYLRITGKDRAVALVGNKLDLERYRTVTKAEGLAMAENFECQCHETSAAEEFESVEAVFQDLLRDISRINERQLPLQNLYISEGEAKPDLLTSSSQGLSRIRLPKGPKSQDGSKPEKTPSPMRQRSSTSTFKQMIFPKKFTNMFN